MQENSYIEDLLHSGVSWKERPLHFNLWTSFDYCSCKLMLLLTSEDWSGIISAIPQCWKQHPWEQKIFPSFNNDISTFYPLSSVVFTQPQSLCAVSPVIDHSDSGLSLNVRDSRLTSQSHVFVFVFFFLNPRIHLLTTTQSHLLCSNGLKVTNAQVHGNY